jgi:hypothetical protein
VTELTAAKKTIELLRLLPSKGKQQQNNEECGNGAAGEKSFAKRTIHRCLPEEKPIRSGMLYGSATSAYTIQHSF